MSSQSSYRNGTLSHSYYPTHASTSPSDSGNMFGSTRDMLPPTHMDFPPRPMEIDLNGSILNSSRTLPNPSASAPATWGEGLFGNHPLDNPFGAITSRSHQPVDNPVRTGQEDPLVQWYSANDGPWIPKQIMDAGTDERSHSQQTGNRMPQLYGRQYRSSSHVDGGSFHYSVPHSDSGYGTRQSVGNTSVFSGDVNERDQDNHSLLGPSTDYQSFSGFNDSMQMQSHDARIGHTWSTPPGVSPPASPNLICPTCDKAVKTPSELKKHDLRHRKPFLCNVQGCKRKEGFSTVNDLDRHTRSKHPQALPESASARRFRCTVDGCKSKDKSWPRLDNFRSHLKRVHPGQHQTDEDYERTIRRGEYLETTNLDTDQDSPSQVQPEYTQAERSAASESLSRQGTQNWRAIEDSRIDDTSIPSIGAVLDFPHERRSLPEPHRPQTVKPLEVFPFQVGTNKASKVPSLDSIILHPAAQTDSAHTNINSQAEVSKAEGKADTQVELSASNDLVEAMKTVLAAVNKAQSLIDASQRQAKDRNSLPSGRTPDEPNAVLRIAAGLNLPDGRSGFSSASLHLNDPEARNVAQALEALKTISRFGLNIPKDVTREVEVPETPAVGATPKTDKKVTCQLCKGKKFTGRPCELKKHMKRHSKPYGCTFANCPKTFGSKNDWKRHENSQHSHQETLRCDIEKGEGAGVCGKVFYRRQTFQDHLKNHHHMGDEAIIRNKLESCRIGRNCTTRFWCGFCLKAVELHKKGLEGWTERFDHIDDHFMGKNGHESKNISDWVYANSDEPIDIDSPAPTITDRDTVDSPEGSSSSSEASGRTPEDAIVLDPVDQPQGLKRKRGSEDEDAGSSKKWKMVRVCCQCGSVSNPRFESECNTCDRAHTFCAGCVKRLEPREEILSCPSAEE